MTPSDPQGAIKKPPEQYGEDTRMWHLVNDFARRSFRDTADRDYIAARMLYRATLFPQFLWSALQCVEKYLKGILLFNRVTSPRGHELHRLLQRADDLPFELDLSTPATNMVEFLDQSARFRYLEASWAVYGPKLLELDRLVWEVRRYCRPIHYDLVWPDGRRKSFLPGELEKIERAREEPYHKFRIRRGYLEKVVEKRDHRAREHLIWQNLFFGTRRRSTVTMPSGLYAENAPLTLHPEILDEVLKYVFLPKEAKDAYRELAEESGGDDA